MPLLVTLIWPSRKALLLFGSSHDSVPGMKVAYSSLAYSSALSVSGLSITTLLFSSTSLPPKAQISQLHQAVAGGVAERHAARRALLLQRLAAAFRKPSVSFGKVSNPAAFTMLSR